MASVQRSKKDFKQEFLTCSICANPFNEEDRIPKCLPCLHCFCKSCLRRLIASTPEVHCPNCRKKYIVPQGGADGFVTNFNVENLREYQSLHQEERIASKENGEKQLCNNCDSGDVAIGYCYDCEAYVCLSCTQTHKALRGLKSHEIVSLEDIRKPERHKQGRRMRERCRVHNKNLSAFCNTCNKPICDTCGITDHSDHKKQDLHKAIDEAVKSLQELTSNVRNKKEPVERLSGMIDTRINDINDVFTKREEDINEQFRKLKSRLRDRCRQSVEELKGRCQALTKLLQEQKADVEALRAQYESACDFADQTCEYANPVQLFKHYEMVTHQLNELTTETLPQNEPLANSFLEFDQDHERAIKWLEEQGFSSIGGTRTSDTSASQCYLEADLKTRIPMDVPQIALFRAVNYECKPQKMGGDPVTADLQMPDGTSSACDVHDNQDGSYKISYIANHHGTYHLDVRVFGRLIQGSPFPVSVRLDSVVDTTQMMNVDIPAVALVGYPHEVFVNLSRGDGDLEKEVRADRLQASIVTQTGDSVKCHVRSSGSGQYAIQHTPPVDGLLSLNIIVNDIPATGNPYSIPVQSASPKATTVAVGRPIANQIWSIMVAPCDYRQNPISVPEDAVQVKVTHLQKKVEQELSCTRNNDGELTFIYIPTSGPHSVRATLYNLLITEEQVDVRERFEINLAKTPQSFPTGITTGTSNAVYVSDTADSNIHCFSPDGSRDSCINLDTKKSSQITLDDQGRLLLLFPQTRMVHIIDQQGNELNRWPCQQKNSRPVAIVVSKEGRAIIADSKIPSMYIYKADGEILSIQDLPKKSVVDGVNNLCVDRRNSIVLAHHSQPTIYMHNSDGQPQGKFSSGATSFQLAVASTDDDLLLVAQLGAIRIIHKFSFVGEIPVVSGHIYTSLASTSDGCFLGLEVGQKRLVKYGCQIQKQVS